MEKLKFDVELEIQVLDISSEVPKEYEEDFKLWLRSKAYELGSGRQYECYDLEDEDGIIFGEIKVNFYVLFKSK